MFSVYKYEWYLIYDIVNDKVLNVNNFIDGDIKWVDLGKDNNLFSLGHIDMLHSDVMKYEGKLPLNGGVDGVIGYVWGISMMHVMSTVGFSNIMVVPVKDSSDVLYSEGVLLLDWVRE